MNDETRATDPVQFEEREGSAGARIGIATLNAPQVLNGLSLQMVDLLAEKLTSWAHDPSVAVVILRAAGDKAFCAGGDLHSLYASARATPPGQPWANEGARRFFENEYRLDYQIHHYPKPILCWGHGIVMGGGMGLMMGASHRVVTETTRMAMPEISIGLFPDVGGSWLLSRMQGGLGLFLGLTGATVNASDALYVGWADFFVQQASYEAIVQDMLQSDWSTGPVGSTPSQDNASRGMNDATLSRILQSHAASLEEDGPLARNTALIDKICAGDDLQVIGNELAALANLSDPWIARAAATYLKGAPGSARLTFMFARRARLMSLADVFRMEYIGVLAALAYGDVTEGIRALLIDKDKQPKWRPATLADANEAWVDPFFIPPWPTGEQHPLADLGEPPAQA